MFGLFGIFGRASELRELDRALRTVGLHPRQVPEAVKLTTVRQVMQELGTRELHPVHAARAAELLGYCMMGRRPFVEINGVELVEAVEARMEAALDSGDSLDARLVLLTLHANVIEASVVDRYGLEAG